MASSKKRNMAFMRDRRAIPCVLAYVERTGDVNMRDESAMIEHFRTSYRDYSRQQQRILQNLVAQAISFIRRAGGPAAYAKLHPSAEPAPEVMRVCGDSDDDGVAEAMQRERSSSSTAGDAPTLHAGASGEASTSAAPTAAVVGNMLNDHLAALYVSQRNSPSREASPASASASSRKRVRSAEGGEAAVQPQAQGRPAKKARTLTGAGAAGQAVDLGGTAPTVLDGATSGGGGGSTVDSLLVHPTQRFSDIGGLASHLQDVRELLEYPLTHPEIFAHLGVSPPTGILLHGPPGCGKTLLAHAIAGELGVPLLRIAATEVVTNLSGDSEARLRELFALASTNAPCIVFMDEIDAIAPARQSAAREMERRIVSQLLACLDDLSHRPLGSPPVIVIGATNRPDSIDAALRREGRFEREIAMGIPDEDARAKILVVLTRAMRLGEGVDFRWLAHATPGFVGADLSALAKQAAVLAINRIFKDVFGGVPPRVDGPAEAAEAVAPALAPAPAPAPVPAPARDEAGFVHVTDTHRQAAESSLAARERLSTALRAQPALEPAALAPLAITMADFVAALPAVQPSAKREGFATTPDVTWDDVGALHAVREEMEMAILRPIRFPDEFRAMGCTTPMGVLLYGPPGCGKTLLAKAIANAAGSSFISIKGPELLSKYVGDSEKAVRQVFQRGRASAPCVVFFDEIDALCPQRDGGASGNGAGQRLVNQLLTEMDGMDARGQVFIIGATNRPDVLDPAIMRPGRLDKLLYVPLPGPADRANILATVARKTPLGDDVDLDAIARSAQCEGFSGADLAALVREAASAALREIFQLRFAAGGGEAASGGGEAASGGGGGGAVLVRKVTMRHFAAAFTKVFPSVSEETQASYDVMQATLRQARKQIG